MFISQRLVLTRAKMIKFLAELEDTPSSEARSLYFPPGLPSSEVENLLKEIHIPPDISPEIVKTAGVSGTVLSVGSLF